MDIKYVVAVKHLKDMSGCVLNRWEYAHEDEGGYIFWSESVNGSKYFYDVDALDKWLNSIGRELLFYAKNKSEYDLNSISVRKVIRRDPVVKFEKKIVL